MPPGGSAQCRYNILAPKVDEVADWIAGERKDKHDSEQEYSAREIRFMGRISVVRKLGYPVDRHLSVCGALFGTAIGERIGLARTLIIPLAQRF